MNSVITVILNQGDFPFQKTFGNVWRHVWLSQLTGEQLESSEQSPEVLLNACSTQDSPLSKELFSPRCCWC